MQFKFYIFFNWGRQDLTFHILETGIAGFFLEFSFFFTSPPPLVKRPDQNIELCTFPGSNMRLVFEKYLSSIRLTSTNTRPLIFSGFTFLWHSHRQLIDRSKLKKNRGKRNVCSVFLLVCLGTLCIVFVYITCQEYGELHHLTFLGGCPCCCLYIHVNL